MDQASFAEKLKINFGVTTNLRDVEFNECSIKKYSDLNENVFGEKNFLLYTCDISIYNLSFLIKVLSFNYEKRNEILKLDIEVPDKEVEKEIARTRNYLKRYRNLNEAIRLLIQTSKFLETRRLITDILFNKEPCITLSRLDDGGLCIQYLKETDSLCVKILVGWRIDRDMNTNTIIDVIEVFYNNFNLPNASVIKNILTSLTHPTLDFHKKLKLWKLLIGCLQGKQTSLTSTQSRRVVRSTSDADNIIVISDSTSTVTDNEQASSIKEANVICTSGIEVQTIDLDSSEADGVIVIPDCREETCPSPRKKKSSRGASRPGGRLNNSSCY